MILDVKAYVEEQKKQLRNKIDLSQRLGGLNLLILQVGDDPRSNAYIKGKMMDCREVGINATLVKFNDRRYNLHTVDTAKDLIKNFDAVFLQMPLENAKLQDGILNFIPAEKDVDGLSQGSPYLPCTPKGIMDYLHRGLGYENLLGKKVTIVGRGKLTGKPLAAMMIEDGATLTLCNSQTSEEDLRAACLGADILVTAVGKEKLINSDMVKSGAVVIDVGINVDENGKLCGDCNPEMYNREDICITTVPGGVGLLTRLALLENIVETRKPM